VLRIDPEEHVFTGIKDADREKRKDPEWDLKIRRRIKQKDFEPMESLMAKMSPWDMTFGDHMAAWSRIDFLTKKNPKGLARFMARMKDPIPAPPGQLPTTEAILQRQRDCFAECIGMDPKAFDTAWTAYVLKSYPSR
jgi:hypothetical protein